MSAAIVLESDMGAIRLASRNVVSAIWYCLPRMSLPSVNRFASDYKPRWRKECTTGSLSKRTTAHASIEGSDGGVPYDFPTQALGVRFEHTLIIRDRFARYLP